jgi:hypothetical protein
VQIAETKELCFYSDLQYFDEQRTLVLQVILPIKIEAYESRKIQSVALSQKERIRQIGESSRYGKDYRKPIHCTVQL